ncbi:hypothetical protein MKW92_041930, partial [Papaver armeniacum]
YQKAPEGSEEEIKALQSYHNALQHINYFDGTIDLIGEFLFGTTEKALSVMKAVRPAGQHVVYDWSRYTRM